MDWFTNLHKEAEKRLAAAPIVSMDRVVNINGVEVCSKCLGRQEYEFNFNGDTRTCSNCNGEGK
jgi:DnaJ-class molecular chaperone